MKAPLNSHRWAAAAIFTTALLSLSPLPAPAQPPPASVSAAPTASAAPSASTSASASVTGAAAPAPAGPFPIDKDEQKLAPIDFEPYPVVTDKPVAPKPKEWVDARLVRFTRRGEQTPYCELRRVREWLRVTCGIQMAAVALIAGNPEGVTVWVKGRTEEGEVSGPAEAMFPMRPGDRRIFQFFDLEPGSWGSGFPKNGPVVQAYWLEGAPAPVVIAR